MYTAVDECIVTFGTTRDGGQGPTHMGPSLQKKSNKLVSVKIGTELNLNFSQAHREGNTSGMDR